MYFWGLFIRPAAYFHGIQDLRQCRWEKRYKKESKKLKTFILKTICSSVNISSPPFVVESFKVVLARQPLVTHCTCRLASTNTSPTNRHQHLQHLQYCQHRQNCGWSFALPGLGNMITPKHHPVDNEHSLNSMVKLKCQQTPPREDKPKASVDYFWWRTNTVQEFAYLVPPHQQPLHNGAANFALKVKAWNRPNFSSTSVGYCLSFNEKKLENWVNLMFVTDARHHLWRKLKYVPLLVDNLPNKVRWILNFNLILSPNLDPDIWSLSLILTQFLGPDYLTLFSILCFGLDIITKASEFNGLVLWGGELIQRVTMIDWREMKRCQMPNAWKGRRQIRSI